jgi:hypothetical protein
VQSRSRWWTITPAGGALIAVFFLVFVLFAAFVKRDIARRIEVDQAKTAEIAQEMNAFSEEQRCRDDQVWRLTSDEAFNAEVQVELAVMGLPSEPVDPEIRARLNRAKDCEGR